jgi:hypothetical protein
MKAYDERGVRELLRAKVREAGRVIALARAWRVNRSFIYGVMSGKEKPSPTILRRLGLKRVVLYCPR